MNLTTYASLRKIAADNGGAAPYLVPVPTKEFALDVLGMAETGYNPYINRDGMPDEPANFNKYYIRTTQRGTHGDPNIPSNKWTSSTAWGPWQTTHAYAQEVAKVDPEFAKYYNSTLQQMYRNMARYGLSRHLYRYFEANGRYPDGYPDDMVKLYDYGRHPFDMTPETHNIVRNGMLTYMDKVVLPMARARGGKNALDQWKQLARIHRFGANKKTLTKDEQDAFDLYWDKVQNNIRVMQDARNTWKAPAIRKFEDLRAQQRPVRPDGTADQYYKARLDLIDKRLHELRTTY